jgi:protein required for attachment to host cells
MKKPVTWVLIADGSQARVFHAAGKGKIKEMSEMAVAHPPTRDMVSDRPGRTFDSMGQGRHAMEAPSDPHDKAEADFLRSVAKKLDASCQRKEFDRLVVVAPPRALGTLRSVFSEKLTSAVTQEIAHDLTGFKTPALEARLKDYGVV